MKAHILQAVEIAGSQKALADQLGVSHQAVWAWINRGNVPTDYGAPIEKATNGVVTRKAMWPDTWQTIWPELAESQAA